MKAAKPFAKEHIEEFQQCTAELSLEATGAWIQIRMRMAVLGEYVLARTLEQWAIMLRCRPEQVTTVFTEFSLGTGCGLRVEWPPGNASVSGECPALVRLVSEQDAKRVSSLKSESLRKQIAREDRNKKEIEKLRIPEDWNLSEKMAEFGARYGMSPETVRHEFEACKIRHTSSLFTAVGWERQVWQTWVMNWVRFGCKQVNGAIRGKEKPPPPPPKTHVIERGLWKRTYGDPKQYGYE